jgi:hypothetical protein
LARPQVQSILKAPLDPGLCEEPLTVFGMRFLRSQDDAPEQA